MYKVQRVTSPGQSAIINTNIHKVCRLWLVTDIHAYIADFHADIADVCADIAENHADVVFFHNVRFMSAEPLRTFGMQDLH